MTTATLLLLLVAASSTVAYGDSPPDKSPVAEDEAVTPEPSRVRRTTVLTPSGSNSGASAGSSSFSGSFSGSGSGSGSGGGKSSYGGPQDTPSGSFGGSGQGYFPDYSNLGNNNPYYPFQNSFPVYTPYNFQQAYQQHRQFMQRLAQQHQAYAANAYGPNLDSNGIDYSGTSNSGVGTGGYGTSGSFSGSGSGFGGGFGQPSVRFGQPTGGYGQSFGGYGPPPGGFGQQFGGYGQQQPSGGFGAGVNYDAPGVRLGSGEHGNPGDSVGAAAVASISPQGGYGSANLYPDLDTRMGGEFPAPSGQNFGVFTSSSSGSSDVNGVKKSFKTSTSGVNDNGKVTSYTVHNP